MTDIENMDNINYLRNKSDPKKRIHRNTEILKIPPIAIPPEAN